ncbi:hypothetical protein Ddc_20323 [Ditylenchus destructor]|nr:hypothetical protein Ddc_20323 [Ditylenchus destructor]
MFSLKTVTIATLVFAMVLGIDAAKMKLPSNVVAYGSNGASNAVSAILQQSNAQCSLCNFVCSNCQANGGTCSNCASDDACTFCQCNCD